MHITFFMRNAAYFRNFEHILKGLATRGHRIRIIFDNKKMEPSEQAAFASLEHLCEHIENIEFDFLIPPNPFQSTLAFGARTLRVIQDYLRYLDPALYEATKTRERSGIFVNRGLRLLVNLFGRKRSTRNALLRLLGGLDRLIPPPRYIMDYLRQAKPDLVMVTPLFSHGSYQADYFKATSILGIRSCLPVASWDNLTSKGLVHAKPDCVLVWNEAQKKEAVELQNIAPEKVIVTGAHTFDHWFTWKPSTTRKEFLAKVGLSADQPYVLYLGSSFFIAPDEPPAVLKWARALRESGDPLLEKLGILIRPHPQNAVPWSKIDVSFLGNAAIHPRLGANPVSEDSKSEFYDSMHHCELVVGVNTSGMIEAGILGKPVHTVLFDDFKDTQEGIVHFRYLAAKERGLLHVSTTLGDHVENLSAALRNPSGGVVRSKEFVDWFVRPAELDKVPTEFCIDVIENLGLKPAPAPRPAEPKTILLRILAAPLLLLMVVQPKYLRSKYLYPAYRLLRIQSLPALRWAQRIFGNYAEHVHRNYFAKDYQRRVFRKKRERERRPPRPQLPSGRKILWIFDGPSDMRYWHESITGLLDRGHLVQIAFGDTKTEEGNAAEKPHPNMPVRRRLVPRRDDFWRPFAFALRGAADYIRYLDPFYRDAPYLRQKMVAALPSKMRALRVLPRMPSLAVRCLRRSLRASEHLVPSAKVVEEYLMKVDPDMVLVSPLVNVGSRHTDVIKSARKLDIKTAMCVSDWGDLTTKGMIRILPDKVLVWSQAQAREAVELHDIPSRRAVVTGWPAFDRWVDRRPRESHEQFCRRVGFQTARPFILFVGTADANGKPSRDELAFARRWLKALRKTAAPLRDAAILIRPHPSTMRHWDEFVKADGVNTVIYPGESADPANGQDGQDQFHSLYYCSAIVGFDPDALVKAAILGKPVLTVLDPAVWPAQEETLRFHYLVPEHGVRIEVAKSMQKHLTQLSRVLENPAARHERPAAFVDEFVSPPGGRTSAAQALIEAIENLAQESPEMRPEERQSLEDAAE